MIMRPFERAYVINLPRRADRLRAFRERLARAEWPAEWPAVEVYPAIDGDVVGTPEEFQHGSGAYGCRPNLGRVFIVGQKELAKNCPGIDLRGPVIYKEHE